METTNYVLASDPRLSDARPAVGGNADTLDGYHASSFLTSLPSHAHDDLYVRKTGGTFTGFVSFSGNAGKTSDMRFKTRKGDVIDAVKTLKLFDTFKYHWDKKGEEYDSIGVSAQQVRDYFPELVTEADDADETLSVDYTGLVPVCIQAIKELSAQIEELKK